MHRTTNPRGLCAKLCRAARPPKVSSFQFSTPMQTVGDKHHHSSVNYGPDIIGLEIVNSGEPLVYRSRRLQPFASVSLYIWKKERLARLELAHTCSESECSFGKATQAWVGVRTPRFRQDACFRTTEGAFQQSKTSHETLILRGHLVCEDSDQ